ncbi:hypothetical protein V8E55_008411 [Tylopilus felleus]
MADHQLDNDLIPLLRNQQTTNVLRMENASVRRLAECMTTRGAIATNTMDAQNNPPPSGFGTGLRQRVTYDDVLCECAEVRDAPLSTTSQWTTPAPDSGTVRYYVGTGW